MVVSGQVIQKLRLAVSARQGAPTGAENEIITEVRGRLNKRKSYPDLDNTRLWFRHGVYPLVKYMDDAFSSGRITSMAPADLGTLFLRASAGDLQTHQGCGFVHARGGLWCGVEGFRDGPPGLLQGSLSSASTG